MGTNDQSAIVVRRSRRAVFLGSRLIGEGLVNILAGKPAQEFTLIHAVLESFATVNEDYRDFVGELTAQQFVGIDIDFLPAEQPPTLQLYQAFLHNLAKMASFAGVNEDLAGVGHCRSVAVSGHFSTYSNVKNSEKGLEHTQRLLA